MDRLLLVVYTVLSVLVICDGLERNAEILKLFEKDTGMGENLNKSTFTLVIMEYIEIRMHSTHFHFSLKILDEGLKYLGFILKLTCYKEEDWNWII